MTDAPKEENKAPGSGGQVFPVVGIGASAGGLEAFTRLLSKLPAATGMAFVLIQHLDPAHESMLTELLSRATTLPVREAREGTRVEQNHIYVIPRNAGMVISGGMLRLTSRETDGGKYMPVDRFLTSLAEDQKSRAIAVILSGTASDGALGIKAVKAQGGITFAQDETSAKFNGMPRSAVDTGCVDFVLRPEKIAQELAAISHHPYVSLGDPSRAIEAVPKETDSLGKIFQLLQAVTGVDFNHYKPTTIRRRIARRMAVRNTEQIGKYTRYLQEHPEEIVRLYEDLLISVTGFFRDPEAFQILKTKAFPRLLKDRPPGSPIRIWVPGCSSGEEAYSIAICLLEALSESGGDFDIQIFSTDISDLAIEKGRAGVYPENIRQEVSRERLERFFVKTKNGYTVSKRIREMCVFAKQDLIKDPPFSRLDLISCRNVLIYLGSPLQRKALSIFYYALKPGGFLLLGSSESIGAYGTSFELEDRKQKLYSKKLTGQVPGLRLAAGTSADANSSLPQRVSGWGESELQKEIDRVVLNRYGPPGVLINQNMEILKFRGDTSPYLVAAPGTPSLQVLKMARPGLAPPLRSAIEHAKKLGAIVYRKGLRLQHGAQSRSFDLEVIPIPGSQAEERLWLVLFQEIAAPEDKRPAKAPAKSGRPAPERQTRTQMQQELSETKESMQTLLEEYEATNEELQSVNEEIQSSNEELQSTNEELQTSKEELQASNEELVTVNEELQNRNVELSQAHSDLTNLFSSVDMPILMVGNDLCIRRFTPAAEIVLNLIPADVGRPIGHLNPGIVGVDLEQKVGKIIQNLNAEEAEVQDRMGRWHLLRIRPYRTGDNKIDGAVLVLIDIDELKQSQELSRDLRAIIETVRDSLVVLDQDERVKIANQYFYNTFRTTAAQTEGRILYQVAEGRLNLSGVRNLLAGVRDYNTRWQNVKIELEQPDNKIRTLILNAGRLPDSQLILLVARDTGELADL
ncbi:MAG: PAS domain-containing protein [Acidobacteria bacterium]|nr:PAS domain-containing protein [Acidobacteriota bacterium]